MFNYLVLGVLLWIILAFVVSCWSGVKLLNYTKQVSKKLAIYQAITKEDQYQARKIGTMKVTCYMIAVGMFGYSYKLLTHNHYLSAWMILLLASVLSIVGVVIKSKKECLINKGMLVGNDGLKEGLRLEVAHRQQFKKLYRYQKGAIIFLMLSFVIPCLLYSWLAYQLSIH
ncbi:hypothetical protein [Vagococcus xieshaowenii]|uniref:Uncharacterized protein n=1 Tax=Vagococcus xieshaowenii TaxID=2562451 RepID=A0AAJ5EFI8_9ENTE|nr:hypothetical protein [Vagococcus xieshaowenii]QCA29199.1 hypothetical protein E4Z98_07665 [Vagococcus xieshaowenii]TFZ40823.1 hypothetical protein E4031_05425 [Vagococcus xieshaowenii]